MLATALFKRGTGSNGSPEQKKCPQLPYTMCVFLLFILLRVLFSVLANLSPSPSTLADDDSLHRCSAPWSSWPGQKYVTWPWQNAAVSATRSHYWRKDPLRQERNHTTLLELSLFLLLYCIGEFCAIYLSSLNKSWSPSGYKAGPQSCQPVSLWLPSPSSIQTQILFCVSPGVCRTHSHKHQLAVDAGADNMWPDVQHVTLIRCIFQWLSINRV